MGPQCFAHLAAMGVPHHGMKVHLWEGELVQKLLAHDDHLGHPEEQYVMTCFQKLVWVEDLQISGLHVPACVHVCVLVCV